MSQTNRTADICGSCKGLVPTGQGTLRFWNGSARRHAPKYAKRSALGILSACTCVKCEQERSDAAKIRGYNKRHGFI